MEPFRPIVDIFTFQYLSISNTEFTLPKAQLVNLLNFEVSMPEGNMSISLATEYEIESYIRVLKDSSNKISLPSILKFAKHEFEERLC